jgi:CubicO group peptidase (beta-lactamase class C family)
VHRRRAETIVLPILALLISGCGSPEYSAGRVRAWLDPRAPTVAWPVSDPALEHMDAAALDRLGRDLAATGTKSFLVTRYGRIVYEWNAWNSSPNRAHHLASLAKPIVGVTALWVAMTDGRLALDTPASRFIDGWAGDPVRSKIRVRELITHTSGLDNVSFPAGMRDELDGWAQRYYEDEGARFAMAIHEVPLLFEPGSAYRYSGIGYYAFAYLLGRALHGAAQETLASLLRERVFEPLGIRGDAAQVGYGRTWEVDGMKLQPCGSGAMFTARALARIATLIAQKGQWNGQQLIDPAAIEALLGRESRRPVSVDHGWWVNWYGHSRSLPPDAILGLGGGHQIAVAVPSLALVMVRLGDELTGPSGDFDALPEQRLFAPLMQAVSLGPWERPPPEAPPTS